MKAQNNNLITDNLINRKFKQFPCLLYNLIFIFIIYILRKFHKWRIFQKTRKMKVKMNENWEFKKEEKQWEGFCLWCACAVWWTKCPGIYKFQSWIRVLHWRRTLKNTEKLTVFWGKEKKDLCTEVKGIVGGVVAWNWRHFSGIFGHFLGIFPNAWSRQIWSKPPEAIVSD